MDLSTSYLGLRLAHPYVAGASPLSAHLDTVKRLEDAGCAALVLHSLFEEQITLAESGKIRQRDPLDPQFASMLEAFPSADDYHLSPTEYLEHLRRVNAAVAIPVIASLNGTSLEHWLEYAKPLEQAGADALELNMYEVVTDADVPGLAVERGLHDLVTQMKRYVRIPVAVKLGPFFSAFANVARQLDAAGADGLVLFNRFYQPDIDIRTLSVTPTLELSRSSELLLRLRWIAILHKRIRANLALTGGVETPVDGIKALLAGADAVQLVSAIIRHGPTYFASMCETLGRWMDWHHFARLDDFRGRLSVARMADPSAFERANYIRALHSWKI
jgi:dihydroorotate dehydrogenase (fumarate)